MKPLFFYLSVFLLFTSCKENEKRTKTSEAQISSKVNQMYTYDKSAKLLPIPNDLLSSDLEKLVTETEKVSKKDEERIKNSKHPFDKPMTLESSLMTDAPDAHTGFKIKKITEKGNTAEVVTEFQYDYTVPKSVIETRTILINKNGWKIDNIIYTKDPKDNLKTSLQDFINYTKSL